MRNIDEPKGFDKAKKKAESILKNNEKLKSLVEKAIAKTAKQKGALQGFVDDLRNLERLMKAYVAGTYREMSITPLLSFVAALLYFVNPLDLIPDFILGFGFLDDITVIAFVAKSFKKEIDAFLLWEASQNNEDIEEPTLGI
jgi:uncharacterized membrane protein YkvA (DUF1232 family)